jgi:replicative DNA helicase
MDTVILKALLNRAFYEQHKNQIHERLFDGDARTVFRTIKHLHNNVEDYGAHDYSTTELRLIYDNLNPLSTPAQKSVVHDFIAAISNAEDIHDNVASELIEGLYKRAECTVLANLAIEASEGVEGAWDRILQLVEKNKDSFVPEEAIEFAPDDIFELMETATDAGRFAFNIKSLRDKVFGIGRREFMAVYATPNVGKTAFMVTLCAAPDGWADQGQRILYVGNEEDVARTKLRAIMAYTGLTLADIELDPLAAYTRYQTINERLRFLNFVDADISKLGAIQAKHKFDIVVIDQLDKLHVHGKFNATHEKLRETYRQAREFAKRHDCAVIGMSQASNEARGKTRVTPFEMEGSKIGKAAELDLAIGIGALDQGDVIDTEPDMTRYLTVGKNKLNGWHGTVTCLLDPKVSRYVV